MPDFNINYVAVLAAAVVNMLTGAVWYAKPLFGEIWAKESGKKIEDMSGSNAAYGIASIGSLVMAFVLACLVGAFNASTFSEGAQTGLIAWVGFVLPTMGANAVFDGKSLKLAAVNLFYPLVSLVIMGAILAVWH